MRHIKKIQHIEERSKNGRTYFRTYALVSDELGNIEEAVGWSEDRDHFSVGQRVEYFEHNNVLKMRLTNK